MGILRLEPLEDRIVLDGAIAVDIATPPTQTADTHVLVISDAVADADAVAEAAGDDVVVLTYDSDSNDLNALSQQISDALGGEKADSIAFFTAGNPGEINLFDDMAVNEVSIKTQQMVDFWSDIGSYVSQNGSVDILGCNIAGSTEGVQLLESIEVIMNDKGTDINLSASTDLTGHEDLGGDWVLEFSTSIDFTDHDVEGTYFDTNEINTWEHVLAPVISIGNASGGDNPIEGGSAAFRLVNLEDQPSGGGIVVLDITHNGSSSDVHVLQEQLTFTAANYATGQQLQYAALLDGLVEGDETVDITISVNTSLTTAANYLSGTPDVVHTINLIDADSVPTVEIRGNPGVVTADGPGFLADPNLPDYVSAYFSITLTRPADYAVEVNYTTVQFSAVSGGANPDFIAESGSVIFAPGEIVKVIDVDIVRDLNDEFNEQFRVDITSVVGGNSVAVISSTLDRVLQTIVDDDDPRGVSFASPPNGASLGDTAIGAFLVTLDEQPIDDVIVTLQVNGSNPGRFFGGGLTEVLTFTKYDWLLPQRVRVVGGSTAGNQTVSIQSITSVGDSDYNGLVDSTTYQFTNVGTIAASTPFITITSGTTTEAFTPGSTANETVGIEVRNLGGTPITFTFDVTVYDTTGPIGPGDIVIPATQTMVINYTGAVGTDGVAFDVLINGDDHHEIQETYFVEITNVTASSGPVPILYKSQGVYNITNAFDDVAPTPTSNVGTVEGGGESGRDFRFLNSGEQLPYDTYLYYGYQVSHQDGTATTADNDYVPITYGHVIEPGTRGSAVVALAAVPDDILESDEAITVSVFNSFDSGTNTIIPFFSSLMTNDDATPGYYVTNATATESSGQLDFIVGITNRDSADMLANSPTESVNYSTADGSAVAPGDYTSTSGTLTFNTSTGMQQIVSVPVNTDANVEADETMFINLSNPLPSSPTQFLLTDGQGVGTILDDPAPAVTISVSDASVTEGGILAFDVTLSGASSQIVSVLFSTQDGTATLADNDYVQIISQLITFNPGVVVQTVNVNTNSDTDFEPNETMFVNLSSPTNATIADGQGEGTILNDDVDATISVGDAIVTEGGVLGFEVTLSNSSSQTITVLASTSDGLATVADNDYTPITNQLITFAPGVTSQFVNVSTIADNKFEVNERMFLNLSSATNATILDSLGQGDILNDDAQPTISISNDSVNEGGTLNFTVTLSNPSYETITVDYATADGTATVADNDYTPVSQTLTFLSGQLTQTISVPTTADTLFEPDETLFVNLSNPLNSTIADSQGQGTILNDEVAVTISVGDAIVTEGGVLGFEVTLSNSSSQTITVLASTSDGLATVADNDYTPITNQLITFAPGVTSQFVNVSTIADNKFEVNERMFLNLSSATNATILDSLGQGDILNDDAQPTISISNDSVNEGGTLNFTVTLSNPSYETITVDYATADGTATVADNDYTPISPAQTLTFLSGELSQTISVSTMVDISFEPDETLFVNLTNPFNSTIADNQGLGTITNDDIQPTISISDASVTEGGVLNFTVSLSHVSFETIEVDYATADGTATLGDNDYTANSSTLTFLSGTLSQTVSVLTTADTKFELNENLFVNLTNPSNATISDAQGVGTILNDDAAPTVTIDDNNGGNAGVAEVLEGNPPDTNQLTFSITLSNTSYEDIAFTYSTADNTATLLDNDYTQVSGQIFTILAGSTTASFTVDVTADTKFEINEIVDVVLDVTSGTVTGSTNFGLQGVILNDDLAPTVTIDDNNGGNAGVAEVLEGNPPDTNQLTFSITLSNASYEDIEFTYSTADNTATLLDNDYTQVSGQTFTILAGATSASFTVDVTADTVYELDEAVDVTLDVTSGAVTGSTNFGLQGVILNDDAAPTVTIDDNNGGNAGVAEVLEGDPADTNQLTFSVSLSNASFEDLEFTYSTADNTATLLDNDYTQVSGQTFTILAGATSATFTVDVTSDLKFETDEIVNVNLDVTSGTVSGSTNFGLQGVILNDDLAPTISITTVSTSGIEGITGVPLGGDIITAAGNYVFQAILSNPTYEDLVIPVFTVDGIIPNFAATAGDNDFVPVNLSLTILSGDVMSSTVTVDFIADNKFEYDETFSVEIGTVTGSDGGQTTSGGVNSVDVTIVNDDGAPILTIDDQTVAENVGSGVMTFTVTRTGFTAFDVDFTINTADNTAVQPTDYTQIVGGMGTVLAGGASNTTTFDVAIIDDGTFELTETFFANITADNATNVSATGNDLQGEGTITDDEPEPVVSITPDTATSIDEGIEGVPPVIGVSNPTPNGTVDITISLTNPSFEDILVTINTNDGTNPIDFNTETAPAETPDGQGDLDYNPISQTFTILAGSTSETFTVSIVPDDKFEFDETFTVDITTVSGSVGGSMYVNVDTNNEIVPITIINDDDKPVIRVTVAPTVEGTAPVGPYGVGGPPTTPIVIGITRSGATAFDSFIQPTTPGGMADTAFSTADLINNDNDYFFLTDLGTLIPASSATTENVTTFTIIEVIQDNKFEFDEMFTITNVLGAETLIDEANSDITFIATIINDDTAPTITINDSSVVDGDTGTQSVVFDIIESNPSYEPVVVTVDTSDGNSTNPDENAEVSDDDYIPLMTTVTFTEGVITDPDNPVLYDITKQETVEAIGDDKYELDEIFLVDLGVSGGSVDTQGSDLQGVGTIINNDLAPSISITPVIDEIPEGNTGTTEATFLIELTNPTYQDLYIDFSSISGGVIGVVPATANSDYMPTSGGVTILENGLSQTVTALINGDFNYEPNEAFSIDLTGVYVNDSGQIPADLTGPIDNQGVVILNDDFPDFVIPTLIPRPIMDEYPKVFEYTPGPSPQILFQPFGWTIDTLEQVRESEPEIVVSPFFPDSQDEELEGFFTIYITEQPEKPLVIEISAEDLPEGAISPKTVTFTPDNWGEPQVISVEDPNWDPDKEIEIVTTVVESDEVYRDVDAPDVNIQPIEVNSEEIIQK